MFRRPTIPSIDAAEVAEGAYILDVREMDEWEAGHAPGAHHVPMMTVASRMDELPTDEPIVVFCRHGQRSAQVVNYLMGNGFENAVNLDGGIVDWVAAGRRLVTDSGREPYIA